MVGHKNKPKKQLLFKLIQRVDCSTLVCFYQVGRNIEIAIKIILEAIRIHRISLL